MRLLRHFRDYQLAPLTSVLLICAFPCIFLYTQNAREATPIEMLPFFLVFICTAAALLLLTLPFMRNMSRAAFFTDLAMLVVINFSLVANAIEKHFPWLWSRYLLIAAAVLLLALFLLLLRKKPDLRIPCVLLTIAFAAVTLMNVAIAVPDIYRSLSVTKPDVLPETDTGITFHGERPNVYYYLFDEYGGYENLLEYFDYDNTPFLTELENRGFNVARESRNTEATYTDIICPNLLNLDYVMEVKDFLVLSDFYLDNSYMVRMFRQNGYQVNLINHLDFIGDTDCNVLTENQTKATLSELLLSNSLYAKISPVRHLLDQKLHISDSNNYYKGLYNALWRGYDSWKYTGNGPTLTIGYFSLPHSPLALARDGERNHWQDHYNWRNNDLYLGQLEFTSDYILKTVDAIQENDPNALIIIQSDHGCRKPIHDIQVSLSDWYDPHVENTYIQNILNCAYYQGQTFDFEGETGINTLRYLFRTVLGAELDPIEPVYDYYNVSENITPFM